MSVWAVLACRAQSERLYCKPLQRIGGTPILTHIVRNIRHLDAVDGIVLAVAEGRANHCFLDYAEEHGLPYVVGPEGDILARVLVAVHRFSVDTMFRVTTECPFLFGDGARELVAAHVAQDRDFTGILHLPLGTTYELLSRRVLEEMAATGNSRYRAPLSLYVREHEARLRTATIQPPDDCRRPEINLAVDHPGQLTFCRHAFASLAGKSLPVHVRDVIRFHDANPIALSLVTSIHEDVFRVKPDQTMARVWT
jgi:spore coat polysaccharide biosynthesis protein SpsF